MTDTLIISDDYAKADELGKMIENITSVSYCGVDQSADKITEGNYGIVVIYMPLTDNIDRVLQLLVLARTKSSVVVSAELEETDLVYRCFENGAADVLITPLHPGLVKIRITGVIKKRIAMLQNTAQEVKSERNKYRTLFENMNSGFTLYRVENGNIFIENANSKVLEAFPKPKEVMLGCNLGQTLPKFYNAFADVIFQVNNTGESARFEKYFDLIDRYMSFNIYRAEPGYVAMLAQDLTEKRLAEKRAVELSYQIKKQYKDLDNKAYELNEAKNSWSYSSRAATTARGITT